MFRFIFLIFFILFSLLLIYQSQSHDQLRLNSMRDRILHPLDTRLRFRVAEVDPRFGLSQQQVIQLSQQAAQIWHDGTQQDLFIYDPNAKLTIHMVYDQRQEDYNAYKKTHQQLDESNSKNQRSSDNLATHRDYLIRMENDLQQRQQSVQAEFEQLKQQRMSWARIENESGKNRQRVEREYQALQQKATQLDDDIRYFQQQNTQYNNQVNQHNQNIDHYNAGVLQANRRFPPREFHKGIFMGNQIEIYQFDSEDDLRITLAHELGHALGLGHGQDPTALMYPILGEQDMQHFKLKPADLALLHQR